MRNFNFSINSSDLINGLDLRAQTSMNTECFSVNNGTYGKIVKDLSAVLPRIRISIFPVDFIIEPIDCCYLSEFKNRVPGFVVSS